MDAINIAAAGFANATQRINIAADNIANQRSRDVVRQDDILAKPYSPTRATERARESAERIAFEPSEPLKKPASLPDSAEKKPEVDATKELIDMKIASYDANANLKVLKKADEMQKNTLDITA